MPYIYLILSVLCMASTSVLGGYYNKRTQTNKGTTPIFNLVSMVATLICWLVFFAINFTFNWSILLYEPEYQRALQRKRAGTVG